MSLGRIADLLSLPFDPASTHPSQRSGEPKPIPTQPQPQHCCFACNTMSIDGSTVRISLLTFSCPSSSADSRLLTILVHLPQVPWLSSGKLRLQARHGAMRYVKYCKKCTLRWQGNEPCTECYLSSVDMGCRGPMTLEALHVDVTRFSVMAHHETLDAQQTAKSAAPSAIELRSNTIGRRTMQRP